MVLSESRGLQLCWIMRGGAALLSAPQDRQRVSRQSVLATLRRRIRTLEEKNRELTSLLELELAYGELALPRESASVRT